MNTVWPEYNQQRVERGQQLVEQLWWSLAKEIVKKAGAHYKWTDEEWQAATELFLRPNDYSVVVTYD
jgi:hypothetical protein